MGTHTTFKISRRTTVLGRFRAIAPHNLIVRFLRNENRFPDSGPSHVALHESVHDPHRTIITIALIATGRNEFFGWDLHPLSDTAFAWLTPI